MRGFSFAKNEKPRMVTRGRSHVRRMPLPLGRMDPHLRGVRLAGSMSAKRCSPDNAGLRLQA